jgi:beta-mannosidase
MRFFSFSTLCFLIMINSSSAKPDIIPLQWQVGHHKNIETDPDVWVKARVPGAVQLDWARHHRFAPFFYADHWKDYLWMEDVYWTYKTEFSRPSLLEDQRLYFISNGIDYSFEIWLNDKKIDQQEGMFSPVELDIHQGLKDQNSLKIIVYPAPKLHDSPADRSQADQSVKPAVSYGWDWHPRLIPLGIWDDTGLQIRNAAHFTYTLLDYELDENLQHANLDLHIEGSQLKDLTLVWTLYSPESKLLWKDSVLASADMFSLKKELKNVLLWWSHDHGTQPLYRSEIELKDKSGKLLDNRTMHTGFRRVRLVMNEGTWQVNDFPKSRSAPPITLELNGRRIFCKGTNWVNPEIFPGIIDAERYEGLTDKAVEANFNMLRIWGGGIVNKDVFFEQCDRKGLLVWQDFPLACNPYEGTASYLAVLEQEAVSIIRRLKGFASVVMWCGGNELFNAWSGMTDQSAALRLLNSLTYLHDPLRPFIMTAPVMGMGHGHYVFRDPGNGKEVFQWMPESKNTAYTEFGMPSPSGVDVLKTFIPEDQLFPPKSGTVWESHHAYNAWIGNTWLMDDMLEGYFGKAPDLETLVAQGQWLQSEGYKCIYEEARRQKPYCSMALNWCFNEPWPTAANNSLINWPLIPKPAYYSVSASCRPILASARIPKFSWSAGELFYCDLFMLNDTYEKLAPGKMIVKLAGDTEIEVMEWTFGEGVPNQNIEGPTARIALPNWITSDYLTLSVEVEGAPQYNSSYRLQFKRTGTKGLSKTPSLNE